MSRSEARTSFTLSAYKKEMCGIFSSTVSTGTLDECPMAYKTLDSILSQIEPAVKVIKRFTLIYNFKAEDIKEKKHR